MTSVLDIIKAKTPKDKFTVQEMQMAMEEAEYQIRNYCNLPKPRFSIPQPLTYVWANMAVDALNEADKSRNPGSPVGTALSSVNVGDTGYSFTDFKDATIRAVDASMLSYTSQLNRFRRMFWNDGSEYEGEEVYDTGGDESY